MSNKEKSEDEVFCRSCGVPIKRQAELCPHCGVRNADYRSPARSAPTTGGSAGSHRSSPYETRVSANWWYGVVGCTLLWIGVFALTVTAGDSLEAFGGFLVLVAWGGLPVSAYYDIQYVRDNSEWDPETVVWVILLSVWLVNLVASAVYIYRRHEVLGLS